MTSEREQSHAQTHQDVSIDHDDAGVGRVSRSAQLDAPTSPIASGLLSRKAERDGNGVAAGAEHAVANASSSSGSALPDTLMRKFEQSLGTDLSSVRIHTGSASAEANNAVGAKAYAMGQDIHFGGGQYDPSSASGQHLIAHEVAHTVQQRGSSPVRQNKLAVSSPHDAAEHEADAAASAMVSGQAFSIGNVSRSALYRDKNFTPGPAPDTSQNASTPAGETDKQAARDKIFAAQAEAQQAIERTAHWTRDQWSQFIGATVESPSVVWQPSMLGRAGGVGAGLAIGAVAGAASTAAKELPGVGFLVSKGIALLGAGLSKMATEKIEGGKTPSAEEASSAGRAAAIAALRQKLDGIDAKSVEAQQGILYGYRSAMQIVAGRDIDKSAVDAANSWADADIAASKAVAPTGNSLYTQMMLSWVGNNAADGNASKSGVNQTDYKKACNDLFGADGIPNYWAMQVRQDLIEMGLPTQQADAELNSKAAKTAGEMNFDVAANADALAKAFTQDQTPAFLHIAQGGGFRVSLRYVIGSMTRDLYGPGFAFLQSGSYTLMTEGLSGGDKTFVRASKHTNVQH